MANREKYTRAAIGHMTAHYERKKDKKGNYLLKKLEFDTRGDDYWIQEEANKPGEHGEIYKQYISQQKTRDLAFKLDKASGAKTLSVYSKLSN